MSLRIQKGHHLLRLTTLTPVNCGDTAGSATVDRPVALDVWGDLPYLPSAGLKGVLAGRWGNVLDNGTPNRARIDLFGAPDDDEIGGGKPSPLVFGDGEPLSFPILLRDGRRAQLVTATTIYRLAGLGLIESSSLRRVEAEDAYWAAPEIAEALPAAPIRLRPARFGVGEKLVSALAGQGRDLPVVLAAPRAAAVFWQMAAEQRTLTALGRDRRVQPGSLRTIEVIPPGSVFLSLVSNLSDEPLNLGPSAPLQLGAWEGIGLGYVRAEIVTGAGALGAEEAEPPRSTPTAPQPSAPHDVMLRAFEAMEELRSRPEAPRVRSAIFDLGPRLRQRGVPATLAFCLAKAGGSTTTEESHEQRAYRWLLRQLFRMAGQQPHSELHRQVVGVIAGEESLPLDFEPTRLWLRRYAETMLPREAKDG